MAHIINTTIISEGTQKAVIHWYFESNGIDGELTNYQIFDPATDFNVPWVPQLDTSYNQAAGSRLAPFQMTLLQSWSSASWFDFTISFDGTIVSPTLVIARDADFYMDFRYFGGLKDRTNPDPTGRLLVTTRDFAPLGSNGFLVLEIKKN
jgi:hypothetical protein